MIDPKLETSFKAIGKKPKKETLSEFIAFEVSQICFEYIQSTGNKPPEALIKNLTFMLYNSYQKKEIMEHYQDET